MLPKISHPVFTLVVPSTKKPIRVRPMLVKEEKLLLIAKVSEDETDILSAIKQVVNLCLVDPVDIDLLTLFDIEYLFLKIRSQSVGSVIEVSYQDLEDDKIYKFSIDLDKVEVKFPENISEDIKINLKAGLKMKYPASTLYDDKDFLKGDEDENFYRLIARCIGMIYDEENVYDPANFSEADLLEFVENLDLTTFEKVREFLMNVPRLHHIVNYQNSLGNARTIEMSTLSDFFTLR